MASALQVRIESWFPTALTKGVKDMGELEREGRPNIVVILADDMGYSDLGCFGSEISTPHLDALSRRGVRFSQFYNTARCSPSRASLLTGRDPHSVGIGVLTGNDGPNGYPGTLSASAPTIAEMLKEAGYASYLSGKWHLSSDFVNPDASWPTRRGFDRHYGIIRGSDHYFEPVGLMDGDDHLEPPGDGSFYLTDAIADRARDWIDEHDFSADPMFLYLAFTAPHWPLQAPESAISKYREIYRRGWTALAQERRARLDEQGLVTSSEVSEQDLPPWEMSDSLRDWEIERMSVYAAQVEIMDAGIGKVLNALESRGELDNTLVLFLSDNGGCAEEWALEAAGQKSRQRATTIAGRPVQFGNHPTITPGPLDTFSSYGPAWAALSNTPFRLFKRWVHEGGIASPAIVSWPQGGVVRDSIVRTPHQLVDVVPTLLEAARGDGYQGRGQSMLSELRGESAADTPRSLFWEHMGNAAVRRGPYKLVREAGEPWELYDLTTDRSEQTDLSHTLPGVVDELSQLWEQWAADNGVLPWPVIQANGSPYRTTAEHEAWASYQGR